MPTLRISDLTIDYQQGGYSVRPIDRMSFEAHDGELVLLLGPSGSGKTTLLSCLAGLLAPSAGTITLGDTEVTGLRGSELADYRRHAVGVVFQAFNLIPSLTARENVAAPLRLGGVRRRDANGRAEELLERVGLKDRIGHRPGQLSGGQQQRVAIARALIHEPPLIVADEPTAHLDYVQVESVLELVRRLAVPGRLVVVATHDERLTPLADRVLDLSPGRRARSGAQRIRLATASGCSTWGTKRTSCTSSRRARSRSTARSRRAARRSTRGGGRVRTSVSSAPCWGCRARCRRARSSPRS